MKRCRITVMEITTYPDLSAEYEIPQEHPCDMEKGQVFYSDGREKPKEMCDSAWETLEPFIHILAGGGSKIYGDWMRDEHSAMLSCNDGFRPVSFYIEALEDEGDHCERKNSFSSPFVPSTERRRNGD